MSRAGIRHDDGPIPPDYAARVRRERETALFAFAVIILVIAAFGLPFVKGI
jgi:hypothetical protein